MNGKVPAFGYNVAITLTDGEGNVIASSGCTVNDPHDPVTAQAVKAAGEVAAHLLMRRFQEGAGE